METFGCKDTSPAAAFKLRTGKEKDVLVNMVDSDLVGELARWKMARLVNSRGRKQHSHPGRYWAPRLAPAKDDCAGPRL